MLNLKIKTMKLVRYNPLTDYVPTSWNSILNSFFNDASLEKNENAFMPNVDISETENLYELHVSVPGMNKEDFNIDIKDHTLIISGERKWQDEKKERNFHRVESRYGSFSRSFTLPEDVNIENISAQYVDGVLNIELPKDVKKQLKTSIKIK